MGVPSTIEPASLKQPSKSKKASSRKPKKSPLYAWFPRACIGAGLPEPIGSPGPEYQFCPDRKWRSDFAWPDYGLLLEIHGGAFSGGGHTRGAGFRNDLEKANEAVRLGYRVVALLPEQLGTRYCFELISDCLRWGGWTGVWKSTVDLAALCRQKTT